MTDEITDRLTDGLRRLADEATVPHTRPPRLPDIRSVRRRRALPILGSVAACLVLVLVGVALLEVGKAADVQRVTTAGDLPSVAPTSVQNVLVVGTDPTGRADTVLVVRLDPRGRSVRVLSLPRDLAVSVDGATMRLSETAAHPTSGGVDVLIRSVTTTIGVPIHHYVGVDFAGMRRLVDLAGGLDVAFPYPTRDRMSGLDVPQPGCRHLDGDMALAYVRSRHVEELRDGRWTVDPTSDVGRIARQQELLRRLFTKVAGGNGWDPIAATRMIDLAVAHVSVDAGFSLRTMHQLSDAFAGMPSGGLTLATLPTRPDVVGESAVHRMDPSGTGVVADFNSGAATAGTPAPPPEAC